MSLVALIGYSRVALVKHTIPETVVGGAIGIACVTLFGLFSTRTSMPQHVVPLALGLLAGGALLATYHSGVEPIIRSLAFSHNLSTGICSAVPLPR
jgi:hypothetical protein